MIALSRFASGLRPGQTLLRGAAVLAACALAACQPAGLAGPQAGGGNSGQSIDPSQPVPVALLVPGGSGSADLEWLSRSLANSARMAAADAQGARIDLRVYETGGDNAAAAAAKASEAVAAGAKIIVGPLFAEAANAVGHAVQGQNVNVLSFSNNADIAGGNVFVLGSTFANVADRLVGYGVRHGKRRILTVAESDVAGQIGANAIAGAAARNGATIAGRIDHPVSQSGIEGVTPAIAAAARSGQVDAVFMTANNQAVLPYLTEKLAAAGVTAEVTQFMGLTRWDEPASRLRLPQLEGGWFALPDTTMKAQFEARYQAAYGEKPHALGSLAYDGVAAIAALARAGKSNALTTRGLTSGAGFNGINGVFRLRPDGSNQRGMAIATIRGGQVVVLDPAPRRFGGAGF